MSFDIAWKLRAIDRSFVAAASGVATSPTDIGAVVVGLRRMF
jgi:hypothetical protein